MPDITMCTDTGCSLRAKCLRYLAIPSGRQSYFMSSPREGGTCTYQQKVNGWGHLSSLQDADDRNGEGTVAQLPE